MKFVSNNKGMTLIEIVIVVGIMAVVMLAMTTMQQNQVKSNNYIEFQLKRTQLHGTLLSQVFNDPVNCACLFAGANPFPANPAAPGATLVGPNPTQVGRYQFVTPGVCGSATMPQPLVDNVGIDSLKMASIRLTNIRNISGQYSGEVVIDLNSTKSVMGSQNLPLRIPVNVATAPSGANRSFVNCSASGSSFVTSQNLTTNGYMTLANGLVMQWGQATAGANMVTVIPFNTPFASTVFSITVSGTNDSGGNAKDNWPTVYRHPALTTTTTFRVTSAEDSSQPISWFAIGR